MTADDRLQRAADAIVECMYTDEHLVAAAVVAAFADDFNDLDKAYDELDRLRAELAAPSSEAAHWRAEVVRLRAENAQLHRELGHLRGFIPIPEDPELDRLRAENAAKLAEIRLWMADVDKLRHQVAALRTAGDALAAAKIASWGNTTGNEGVELVAAWREVGLPD